MIRVLDSAGSTLVEWGRQQQQEERKLYFNNLLHIYQHTSMKYMMQLVIEGKNQKTNMSVYDIPL